MGAGHDHHAGGRHRWRLAVAVALVGAFFLVELVVSWLSGSLALLSDAGHMAADVVALSAALVATRVASRPDRTGRRTYGSYRAEVFASGLAVLLMLGVAVYVVVEALRVDPALDPRSLIGMAGGEGATLGGSKAYRIAVDVELPDGRRSAAEVVILLLESDDEPYRVLSWRNGSDGSTAPQRAPSK